MYRRLEANNQWFATIQATREAYNEEIHSNLSSHDGEVGCEPFRLITWKVIHHTHCPSLGRTAVTDLGSIAAATGLQAAVIVKRFHTKSCGLGGQSLQIPHITDSSLTRGFPQLGQLSTRQRWNVMTTPSLYASCSSCTLTLQQTAINDSDITFYSNCETWHLTWTDYQHHCRLTLSWRQDHIW